jgi:3-methyladenine DNA glycosylase AlkC
MSQLDHSRHRNPTLTRKFVGCSLGNKLRRGRIAYNGSEFAVKLTMQWAKESPESDTDWTVSY